MNNNYVYKWEWHGNEPKSGRGAVLKCPFHAIHLLFCLAITSANYAPAPIGREEVMFCSLFVCFVFFFGGGGETCHPFEK